MRRSILLLLIALAMLSYTPALPAQPGLAQTRRSIALPLVLNGDAPGLTISASSLIFNAVQGSSSQPLTLTLHNSGSAPLTISSLVISGSNTSPPFGFAGGQPALPLSLAAGAKLDLGIVFRPATAALGVQQALLQIGSNAPGQPARSVELRGLGTAGLGGANEPSLQWVLDTYALPINVADSYPNNTVLGRQNGLLGDEVALQRMQKAGAGPVTIEPLAVFGPTGANPVTRLGWYRAGEAAARSELFSVANQPADQSFSNAQTLNPQISGTTSFDPGAQAFGFYSVWPFFKDSGADRVVFSQDALNAFDPIVTHHVRVYPLKTRSGADVANAYLVAFEEHTADRDWQDLVFIVRNVQPVPVAPCSGCTLALQNRDRLPYDDMLVFSRLNDPTPKDKDDDGNLNNNGPDAQDHDSVTLRISNPGKAALEIAELTTTSFWRVDAPIILPTTIAPNAFLDVPLRFTATYRIPQCDISPRPSGIGCGGSTLLTGTLSIRSSDPARPTRVVELHGIWQDAVENSEPPLQLLFDALGYTTVAVAPGEAHPDGYYTKRGDEVLSAQWERVDTTKPVVVTQLAAYHGCCRDPESFKIGGVSLKHNPIDSQSLLPRIYSQTLGLATKNFTPNGKFTMAVGGYSSDRGATGLAHALRFYPAKDRNGQVITNTYLLGQDYTTNLKQIMPGLETTVNFDYQDNVYLITNVRPAGDGINPNPTVLRRINAGGPTYTDGDGNAWENDAGLYTPADAIVEDPPGDFPISNTTNIKLYQDYRGNVGKVPQSSRVITYEIPVSSAVVGVRLHFAELYWGRAGGGACAPSCIGKRVFDIYAEGEQLANDFDIYATAGGAQSAVVLRFDDIQVNDGMLTLRFAANKDYPSIAGIELLQSSP